MTRTTTGDSIREHDVTLLGLSPEGREVFFCLECYALYTVDWKRDFLNIVFEGAPEATHTLHQGGACAMPAWLPLKQVRVQ